MKKPLQLSLIQEEKQATKWFLGLFYGIFIIYEVIYSFILSTLPWVIEDVNNNNFFDYLIYLVLIAIIPLFFYLMKVDKPGPIKYILFISYATINLAYEIWFYSQNEITYSSGNLVELVTILFSPIFVNKNFFYIVFLLSTIKYLIIGYLLQFNAVVGPLLLIIVFSVIAFIILMRITSYVDTVKDSYDKQIEGIVKGVIATLELKDPYTRGHSERVAEYAMALATKTGKFGKNELKYFYYACLLHDIGKIHIPDAILTKPGKLTKEEFDIIKMHPLVGAKAVQEVEGISANIDVIRNHHERWDGKGYPDQLEGEETTILARITAIADAFDAMTSSRSYRSALTLEEAYSRILDGKGSQFDPKLVELFQDVYPDWKKIHEQYNNNRKEVHQHEST
ncbi:HD-GYP domain-containing protein [Paucisalibacillus globulus]|uniref:HD-GYP domain-containing protein n=1 Tax=Paucisalibacillus globulus TaxID=351095 RepID=UPI000406FCDB|nr:HD-GYP domain-containing protein [Paucisalibacillus globulus]